MIHLQLTIQEATALRTQLTADGADTLTADLRIILHKLDAAHTAATRLHHCPVCQRSFTQTTQGRTGLYCSPACKQKAYRQRQRESRRQYGPSR